MIVGWSTRNRPLLPRPINDTPLMLALLAAAGLAQLPEKLGRSGVAASRRVARTGSLRTRLLPLVDKSHVDSDAAFYILVYATNVDHR